MDWARRIELVAVVLGVLLSSLVAAVGIWYSNDQVRQEMGIAQEGQITDRYTKAVENLGDDAMDVRLGGIYALQRIMEDSPRDHPTIANVLATYVRTHASKPPKMGDSVSADLQAAVTVLTHRDTTRDKSFVLDLRHTDLPGIELQPRQHGGQVANLSGANLQIANLSGANLSGADLSGADLSNAKLSGANLDGTDLSGADLSGAFLRRTALPGADLDGAFLDGADLDGAFLDGADLTGADLTFTRLRANLTDANLTDAKLIRANLTGAKLIRANLSGADLTDAKLTDAKLHGANLSTANLNGVDLTRANLYWDTKLPSYLAEDPEVKARIAELGEKTAEDHG
ncbi:hypothetical protein AR457_37895 [Streptomyces agglomeratus]|nr:hypothetical protein AR457_37895 [Streptomyces agglomeratus]